MFFLAILSAARCEQFYQGCTQNYKDVLGTLRSHSIKDFLFCSIILFDPREQIYNWQILWRNIFRFWLQFLPGLEARDLEQFLYYCQRREQGLQDIHQREGNKKIIL